MLKKSLVMTRLEGETFKLRFEDPVTTESEGTFSFNTNDLAPMITLLPNLQSPITEEPEKKIVEPEKFG